MRSITTALIATCMVLLIGAGTTHAISVEPVSPEQTLANAEMIVAGTITDVRTRWSGFDESMIATDYTITLDRIVHDPEALFGAKAKGEMITLSFAGGTIGEKWVAVPGVPRYELGEQAIFFIDGDWVNGISPLVGITAGDYRISNNTGLVLHGTGGPVERSFFAGFDDAPGGFTLDEFISEIIRALPEATADKSLELGQTVEIPDEIRHLVFAGDQIPRAVPIMDQPAAIYDAVALPASDATPLISIPEPEEVEFSEAGEFDQDQLVNLPADKYAFLWGPPDATSNFNIPPIYYSGTLWGPNFEYSLSDWNRYADLFRKYTTSDNTFGHQGRNDFAFTDWTTFQTVYGFSLPSTVLGIAVMYNSAGNNISVGEKIYESDIILNVDKSWTLDWAVGYANCSVWFMRSTTVHEAGHCFGREHQFTADPAATYHSVMNYPPCGALDTEFWLPLVDDPQSIRAAYPGRINAIDDLGVELFRTAGGGGSSGIPVVWSTFNSTVEAGQTFSMNNFIIENLGTTTMTPAIGWYLCPNQQNYTGAIYLMSTTHSAIGTFAYWNTSRTITVPVSVPPGNYYIAAAIQADDHDWNRSCWTNTRITVTCPQVSTPTGLTCTAGCGYIDLSWNAATNATSYRIYRDGVFLTSVTGTSYRDNSPGASQRCYQVAGQNDCDVSGASTQSCCTALSAPATPTGFSCTAGCGYIDLNWTASSGATAYRVFRGGQQVAIVAGTSYRDNSPGGAQQCYTVRATNSCGTSAATAQSCCTALTAPPALSSLVCTPLCGAISLDWSPSTGATSYWVYRDGSFLLTVSGSGYQDPSPGSGECCYIVTAVNVCGESSDSPRACCTALGPPEPPASLTCDPGCGYIDLTWPASSGATLYRIFRDGTPFSSTTGTSWRDNSPETTEHCYHVTAENNCGESGDSPTTCCTALWPPEPPASLTCIPGCGYIDLTWPASAGAEDYCVYRDGVRIYCDAVLEYRDNDPGPSERCYRVTAINACGESGMISSPCLTALWPPDQVQAVEATTTNCDSIMIRWNAVDGALGYRVYRDGAGIASIVETHYTDHVDPGCYLYEITALNDCGEGPPSERVEGCRCEAALRIEGYMVYYDMVKHIPDVTVDLTGDVIATTVSDAAGFYSFDGLSPAAYQVTPWRMHDDDGVSIADVVKIRRHLAVLELFDTPYKYLAADVTCDGSVSISDVVKIRRYLAQLEGLPCGNWIFVDSSFAISDANWFAAPQWITGSLTYDWTDSSFVGVRLGDVNNTWAPVGPAIAKRGTGATQSAGGAAVSVRNVRNVMVDDLVEVQIEATDAGQLSGVELHLSYFEQELSFVNVTSASASNFTANDVDGEIHLVWEDLNNPIDATDVARLFTLSFRVAPGMIDSGEIEIDGEIVDPMGDPYDAAWENGYVVLSQPASVSDNDGLVPDNYYLSANYPNPFNPETNISFGLSQASHVTLSVYNVMGQRVNCIASGEYAAGDHQVVWNGRDEAGDLVGSGVYFYRLDAGEFTQTRKMTLMK